MIPIIRISMLAAMLLAPVVAPAPVLAVGGDDNGGSSAKVTNADYAAGKRAVDAKQWDRAIAALSKAVATDAGNADAFNYLGYAYRKSGDFERALASYKQALALDPKHRGAHEYIGEAYLELGDLESAERHLKRLDKICFFGCDEYRELKNAVAAFKKRNPS